MVEAQELTKQILDVAVQFVLGVGKRNDDGSVTLSSENVKSLDAGDINPQMEEAYRKFLYDGAHQVSNIVAMVMALSEYVVKERAAIKSPVVNEVKN